MLTIHFYRPGFKRLEEDDNRNELQQEANKTEESEEKEADSPATERKRVIKANKKRLESEVEFINSLEKSNDITSNGKKGKIIIKLRFLSGKYTIENILNSNINNNYV